MCISYNYNRVHYIHSAGNKTAEPNRIRATALFGD